MANIHIPWLRYRIEMRVESSLLVFDPLRKGYHLRTMIETVMKRQFPCRVQEDCRTCGQNRQGCEYPSLFMPQIAHANSSSSIVIVPSPDHRLIFEKGETLSFEVRLFGALARHRIFTGRIFPAVEHAGHFTGMGKWRTYKADTYGRFEIKAVFVWNKNTWQPLPKTVSAQEGIPFIPEQRYEGPSEIVFITPVLIKRNKKPVAEPNFVDFIKGAERRIQSLMGTHERLTTDAIIKSVDTVSIRFKTFQMDASRKEEYFILGRMEISHIPEELESLIGHAGLAHIGKGVSMGMGGFVVRKLTSSVSES